MRKIRLIFFLLLKFDDRKLITFAGEDRPTSLSRTVALWWRRLIEKKGCSRGGFYLYHTRKAAGTTLRALLKDALREKKDGRMWETEGLSIDARFLALKSVITVVSVRDPVVRALSMYWYEHVGWWDGIQHDHSKLRSLIDWIAEWKDESVWKHKFATKNPGNVYIEIQNYMTKMLSGWNQRGQGEPLDDTFSLDHAINSLHRFDFVFVCERSRFSNHTKLLAFALSLDPQRVQSILKSDKLKADDSAKRRLAPKLVPDLDTASAILENLNHLDRRLYSAAIAIDDARTSFFLNQQKQGNKYGVLSSADCESPPIHYLNAKNGIFRPPGHKH
mmetsp:Transcript_11943/g.16159  ORF Transcript_11943/g.16159 Transcript_11943/m.16159 type:complete len:332 (+) Transcript_11943:88-1083(+)